MKIFRVNHGSRPAVKSVLAYDVLAEHACLLVHSIHGPNTFDMYDYDELELICNGEPGDVRSELRILAHVVTGEDLQDRR